MKIISLRENKDGSLTVHVDFTHEELEVIVSRFFNDGILEALKLLKKKANKKSKARRSTRSYESM